ncbi:MAG TPA: hypothetical protein VGX03_02570 [Candidatus Binatia bacterium]|jgi:hypothetical protein|nr:hypothetical protein [Candidatus Binatia bacterium]
MDTPNNRRKKVQERVWQKEALARRGRRVLEAKKTREKGGVMTVDQLADLLERSETHRLILGNTSGPYSLGVTLSPDPDEGYAFLLKIADPKGFPDYVTIQGLKIRLIVQGGFRTPKPLPKRMSV